MPFVPWMGPGCMKEWTKNGCFGSMEISKSPSFLEGSFRFIPAVEFSTGEAKLRKDMFINGCLNWMMNQITTSQRFLEVSPNSHPSI